MQQLLALMQQLREECPWDRAQTPQSLTRYAIEEAYEVEAAIRQGNVDEIRDELGDLLLQVVFQAQMHSEQNLFNFQDVVQAIAEKLIRRHPHVFEKEKWQTLSQQEVALLWQQVKQQEKQGRAKSRLDEVKHAPALQQAEQIQKNAEKIGFDFPDIDSALGKVDEEIAELKLAIRLGKMDEISDELGDCLFSLVNVGRKLNLSNEQALLSTIYKFRTRFQYIEDQVAQQQRSIEALSLAEMDALWNEAKIKLKK